MGSNFPTFPFALPTGGAEPLSVSHVYPPKVNSLGPVIEEDPVPEVPVPEVPVPEVPVPEVPVPEVPVPEVPVPEVPVPEVPVPEVPVPEVPVPVMPVPEVPVPEVPVPEVPVPEVPVPEVPVPVPLPEPLLEVAPLEPLWAGVRGMVPPPHPTRENTANTKTHVLSIERSF